MSESRGLKMDFTLKELTLSCPSGHEDVPGNSATVEIQDNKLVCVEYPAVINNVDKMLDCLGGERTLSKTFNHPNRRLELRFRPKDPFCHSLCGNRFPSTNLLLRVRRRVRKKDPKDAEIHMDVLGVIGTTYKFQGMADFQYLAMHTEGGKNSSLYDKIIVRKMENQEFFEKPMPYFLPPAAFSRLDTPVDYYYRPDTFHSVLSERKSKFIGPTRNRRPNNAIFVSFNDPSVPTEPLEAAKINWNRVCVKEHDKRMEQQMRQMFESRPIWSRNAIKANMSIHPDKLKLLLPICAYYMVTGPWRSLWVRLGYDPRKDKEAKKYQLLDYRIRCSTKHGFHDMPVKAKRSSLDYSLPITVTKAGPHVASLMELTAQEGPSSSSSGDQAQRTHQLKESFYIFREGMLPPHRQMFYQLCDLDVKSVKQVLEQEDAEQVCDERDGWCAVGTTDKLRDIISEMIKKVIRAQKPASSDYPRKHRRATLKKKPPESDSEDEQQDEDYKDDDDDEDFHPSEGSDNEMETEMLDYI